MKSKIVLGVILPLFCLQPLTVAAFWWWRRPQVVTFDDGSKLTLIWRCNMANIMTPPTISGAKRAPRHHHYQRHPRYLDP